MTYDTYELATGLYKQIQVNFEGTNVASGSPKSMKGLYIDFKPYLHLALQGILY